MKKLREQDRIDILEEDDEDQDELRSLQDQSIRYKNDEPSLESLAGIAGHVLGPKGSFSVKFCILFSQIGAPIGYLMYFCNQVNQIICQYGSEASFFCNIQPLMAISVGLFLIPLIFPGIESK